MFIFLHISRKSVTLYDDTHFKGDKNVGRPAFDVDFASQCAVNLRYLCPEQSVIARLARWLRGL